MRRGTIIEELTIGRGENGWSSIDAAVGTIVFRWDGHTYGLIGPRGVAVATAENGEQFYEIPSKSVRWEQ